MRGSKGGRAISDQRIITRVLDGDRDAYRKLVIQYQKLVYYAVLKIVQEQDEAQDLTQEAFISAYQSLRQFKQESSFSTWLLRIAVNKALDYKRKKKPLPISDLECIEQSNDTNLDPLKELLERETQEYIQERIQSLPDVYREVVQAYYFQEMNYKEIARRYGVEVKTVESRLYRARQKLKQLWKEGVKP